MVVHHEKIVELCGEHLLETVQNHVVECFDQGNDHWLMNQVHVVLLWVGDLELETCDISNDDPDYFFGKLCNYNRCKKMRSTIFHEWCVDVMSNSLIP